MDTPDLLNITTVSELKQASESFVRLLQKLRTDLLYDPQEFEDMFYGHYKAIANDCFTEADYEFQTDPSVPNESRICRRHRIIIRKAKEAASRLFGIFEMEEEDRVIFETVLSYCYACRLKVHQDPITQLLNPENEG